MLPRAHPRISLGYFALKASLFYPPHAIVMSDASYAVILALETVVLMDAIGMIGRIYNGPGC